MWPQRLQVEAVDLSGGRADHAPCLRDWYVVVGLRQPLARLRPGAFGVREIVAPEHVVETDLVAHADLAALGVRRADEAVAVERLTRREGDAEVAELLRAFMPEVEPIPEPEQVRHPPATGF